MHSTTISFHGPDPSLTSSKDLSRGGESEAKHPACNSIMELSNRPLSYQEGSVHRVHPAACTWCRCPFHPGRARNHKSCVTENISWKAETLCFYFFFMLGINFRYGITKKAKSWCSWSKWYWELRFLPGNYLTA